MGHHLRTFLTPAKLGFLSTTLFGLVQFLVIAFYPFLAEAANLSLGQIILSFTLGSLIFIWGAPFWAKKSDDLGRLPILGIGLLGLTASLLGLLVIIEVDFSPRTSFTLLIINRLFYGITASAIVSVVQAWWRDEKDKITQNMMTHSMGLNLGRMLAPICVLLLQGELRPLLWILALLAFTLSGLALFGGQKTVTFKNTESREIKFSRPFMIALISTTFLGYLHSTLAAYLKAKFILTSITAAEVMSEVLLYSSIIVLILQMIFRQMKPLKGKTLFWIAGISWFLASVLLGQLNTYRELWIAITLLSIGIASITPAYLSCIPAGGRAAGMMGAVQTLGLTLGGAFGFFVLQGLSNFELPLLILCAFLFFSVWKVQPHSKEGCTC